MTAIVPSLTFSTGTDAAADSFALTEDGAALASGTILTLDVLANDVGGAGNTLWSIGSTATIDTLKTSDIGSDWERSAGGNLIRIVNGKVEVDLAGALAKYAGNIQALNAGDKITDSFYYTILLADGTLGLAQAQFTLTGTNDAPVITSAIRSLALTEDSGPTTAAGQLTATDPDLGTALAFSGSKSDLFGTLTVQKNGAWSYALKTTSPAVQSLTAGELKTLDYPVTVSDGKGGTATQTLSVTITGTNDAPVITSARTAGALTEDGKAATATGKITATDADHGTILTFAATPITEDAPKYGTMTVDATGKWTFTLAKASPEVQGLAKGEVKVLSYTVTVTDDLGSTAQKTVTVTLTGTNDAPTITSAQKAGFVDEGSPTTQAAGQIVAADADLTDKLAFSVAPVKSTVAAFGDFTVDQTGRWVFELNNASKAVQALANGEQKILTYTVLVADNKGGLAKQVVSVTITGTNDAPQIGTSTTTGALTEDARPFISSGKINASDIDRGDVLTFAATPALPENTQYGSFSIDNAGRWTFVLNKAAAAVQALAAGEKKVLEYGILVTDKAGDDVYQTVSITLTGANDAAVITNSNTKGVVVEDGSTATGGILSVTDRDSGEAIFKAHAETALAGQYGHFTFDAQTGAWSYTLDNASAAVQALGATDSKLDSLVVTSADGTAHTINVTVKGMADIAPPPPPQPNLTLLGPSSAPDFSDRLGTNDVTAPSSTVGSDNVILPDGGTDFYNAGPGNDSVVGGRADDSIYGNDGNDAIVSSAGNDRIDGGAGNDWLRSGSGSDSLSGGTGKDTLFGDTGADTLSGGEGSDMFVFIKADDRGDLITDFKSGFVFEDDKINLTRIDADSTLQFTQRLVWGGTTATAHGVWTIDNGDGTITLAADNDGDTTTAEFWVKVVTTSLTESNVIFDNPPDLQPPYLGL
ncbi:VCBS domain-containing protein [Paragemmobacter straminiformis]|uniref:Cadherin-like domain-containing protein n=1 Tax=Paragemmobacter straminiformis TaxID=2045119 RepID=A0A842I9V7_9RHOB|nr:VCBS domain-containing protein [Gemmobacter straminiformis]MBC2836396.1 cadherin-like domain-containing protein [Gemmobacter straminiformis]